jgi:hypothetical protein
MTALQLPGPRRPLASSERAAFRFSPVRPTTLLALLRPYRAWRTANVGRRRAADHAHRVRGRLPLPSALGGVPGDGAVRARAMRIAACLRADACITLPQILYRRACGGVQPAGEAGDHQRAAHSAGAAPGAAAAGPPADELRAGGRGSARRVRAPAAALSVRATGVGGLCSRRCSAGAHARAMASPLLARHVRQRGVRRRLLRRRACP